MILPAWLGSRDTSGGDNGGLGIPTHRERNEPPHVRSHTTINNEERTLAAKLKLGDEAALNDIIDQYGERLHRIAFAILHVEDTAADVVQDALVAIWMGRDKIDIDQGVYGYLIRSVRNRALDVCKHDLAQARLHHAVTQTHAETDQGEHASVLIAEELAGVVRRALAGLQPRVRDIFLMHREAGMSYAEIAAALGIAQATVHSQMARAVRHIANAISRFGAG